MQTNTPEKGTKRRWRATHKVEKTCAQCEQKFTPDNRAQKYCCIPCRTKAQHAREKDRGIRKFTSREPRSCKECGNEFLPRTKYSGNAKYCSDACRIEGIKKTRASFLKHNPSAQQLYNRARDYQHGGGDTLKERLYKKYPDLPQRCENPECACDDVRILEAAHKPGWERKGSHRVMKYYERHMFWMLCPNCHTYLDLGIKTSKELNLP